MPQAKDGMAFRIDKFWRGYSTFCGQGANGKQFQGNMGAAVVFIDIFRNRRKRAFSRKSGSWD